MQEPVLPGPLVFYDGECALCRELAALMARRAGGALAFRSWQDETRGERPAALRVVDGARVLDGDEAWAFVVARHPDMAGLGWLARKVGVSGAERAAGKVLASGLGVLRKLCWRCPR